MALRYALVEVQCSGSEPWSESGLHASVSEALGSLHGDAGLGALKISLNIKAVNGETGVALIRGSRADWDLLASALPFVLRVDGRPARLVTLHVGGSIRTCQRALLAYHRRALTLSLPKLSPPDQQFALETLRK